MSKKKLLSLTALGIFVFYLISCAMIYPLAKDAQLRQFNSFSQGDYDYMTEILESSENIYDAIYKLCSVAPDYPMSFILQDSDGNVIETGKPKLVVYCRGENEEQVDSFIIDMEEYLTDEVKQQIPELKKFMQGSHKSYRADSLSVCKNGDEYIPVEAKFSNFFYKDYDFSIQFTDRKPDFTIYYNEKYGDPTIYLSGVGGLESKYHQKEYEKIYENIDSRISDFKNIDSTIGYYALTTSVGGIYGDGLHREENHLVVGGKKICFYFEERCNIFYETLTSYNFISSIKITAFAFTVIALVIMIVILKLYNKNQRLNKSREAFVAAAAHELKTPLSVIANKCECILEDVSPERSGEYVNSIYDESKRMSRMVKTLLQYNKLSQDTKIQKKPETLSDIISEQVSKYQPLFEAKNITYSEDIEKDFKLKCNKDLIALVIDNFLSNAVKFTPKGGKIKITAKKLGGEVSFEIFNSGSSISKEDAPHIWEELYSGDKARTRTDNSAGMGLAICRLILELHKLEYGFRNVTDGVIFRFMSK